MHFALACECVKMGSCGCDRRFEKEKKWRGKLNWNLFLRYWLHVWEVKLNNLFEIFVILFKAVENCLFKKWRSLKTNTNPQWEKWDKKLLKLYVIKITRW